MYRFSQVDPFMLAHVIRETTPDDVIAEYEKGKSFSRGVDVHISALAPEYKNARNLRRIFSAIDKPALAINYDADKEFKKIGLSEDERIEQLIAALEAGASAIDLQGFTFDPLGRDGLQNYDGKQAFVGAMPKEVTVNANAVDKQTRLIEKVHSMGKEVLISTHTGTYLNTEQALSLAEFLQERDPDIIKIVCTGCDTTERALECLRTAAALKERAKSKVSFHSNGKKGYYTRLLCPLFGSYMAFCVREYGVGYDVNQLQLEKAAEFYSSAALENILAQIKETEL